MVVVEVDIVVNVVTPARAGAAVVPAAVEAVVVVRFDRVPFGFNLELQNLHLE